MKNVLPIALAAVMSTAAQAAPNTVDTSFGNPDCGEWTQNQSQPKRHWLMGFLTGMNFTWNNSRYSPHDPLDELNSAEQAFLWMDNYCRQNPLERVSSGAQGLFLELVKKKRGR